MPPTPATELILRTAGAERRICLADAETDASLADVLARHGVALNTRCGQRGWCKGCMVDFIDGPLTTAQGEPVDPGAVRSCTLRLVPGSRVTLGIRESAKLGLAPQVGESFELNVPYRLDPLFAVADGRDTALAVDIGTTTVVVMLVDLTTGTALSRASGFNAQIRFGDNVLTRIGAATSPAVCQAMRQALVEETLSPLIAKACERAGRPATRLAGAAVAGNTTMLHILAGEDPTPLGIAPFTPRFLAGRVLAPADIGLRVKGLAENLPLQLLPGLSAYVGADITAGVYATGMVYDETPGLLVDMGTNGEVVLHTGDRLVGCATAAGPAFEGAGLSSGTRAQAGAVETIRLGMMPFTLDLEVIGGGAVTADSGICGSAYVDFLATARASGLLRANGRFERQRWTTVPPAHRIENDDGYALRLMDTPCGGGPRVTEVDVAHLLQAKAAIGAGIETLLDVTGLAARDIGTVWLAGGFGMHIDVPHAIAMGLLPGFRPAQVRVVGNTSLGGAILTALDRAALPAMEALRARIEVVELNLHEKFEDRYIDHLSL